MAIPSGLSAQFGIKTESTWGTPVTVDTFIPLVSESMQQTITRLDSQGIRAGRRVGGVWKAGAITCAGDLTLELSNKPTACLMNHMFGGVSTAGSGTYTHTFTPGDLSARSFTAQIGVPDISGAVRTKTYAGCKITSWEISCAAGEIAQLTCSVSAKSEATNVALAAASYLTGISPFVFTEGSLSIAGSAVATVKAMNLTGDNVLAADRHFIGSAAVAEQLEAGLRTYSGSLTAEFESLTAYARYAAGTEAALVMAFNNGTDTLTITSNVRFDGTTPVVAGSAIVEQPLPFVCLSTTSDAAAVTAVLVNTEASAA